MKKITLFVGLLLLAVNSALLGQVGTEGAIIGVVKDTTGAVVPGADITVTNLDTGLEKTLITDDSGNFEILALPRGPYSVSVSLPGFKNWVLGRTELTVGERKRLSPILEVGEVTEQVLVEAQVGLMQTDKATVKTNVEMTVIRELPLNGRDPVELVRLVPGMRYLGKGGRELAITVQGLGNRDDQTEFQLDGLNSNAGMNEKGMAIPNVDTIAEFNVETSNFSAEHGRNPLQLIMVTKSGTNEFHGTVWEFHRNDSLDARNTFATGKPKLIRNQFGFAVGGPIIQDKTHFFGSFEGIRIRGEKIYNSATIAPEMLQGDFLSLGKPIIDLLTGDPFPGNIIPESRFSNAANSFFPFILLPNSSGNRFRAVASRLNDTNESMVRIDHQITDNQRIYGRWVVIGNDTDEPGFKPDVPRLGSHDQHNVGLNYNYNISPTTLFTIGGGYIRTLEKFSSPVVGINNLTQEAGLQGFPTEGRGDSVGLPSVSFTGYQGFAPPWGVPGRLWMESQTGKTSLNLIRGEHSISFGYEFNNRSTYGEHASCCTRGVFGFNGQHTEDGFADYLLGFVSSSARNFPIQTFGMSDSPYSAIYVQDSWRVHPNVTLNFGLRWDYWHEKAYIRGNGASFDVSQGKALAGVDCNTGQVDLVSQPVAKFLAKATEASWIPGTEVGAPCGLHEPDGYVAPRVGLAWRPTGSSDLVVRGGYGIFASSLRGNPIASSIVGPPYWSFESSAWSRAELQRWETAWPSDPTAFVTPSVIGDNWQVDAMKAHEWNFSIQKSLPFNSAITVGYVGNRIVDMITADKKNQVPPGEYANLQAAKPWPVFGAVELYENIGDSWYNSLQVKWERRFTDGLAYTFSYAFSKHIEENGASLWDRPTPFAPEGYNRGRSQLDHTHILAFNTVWELPFGRGRTYGANLHPVANAILGGWQFSTIYNFISGDPLTFGVPGATLGNGNSTRPNQVGNPELSGAGPDRWFNLAAFEKPPPFIFGSSGIGILDGPGDQLFDVAFVKNFAIDEDRRLQFRWEMFNAPNHVNLNNPVTNIGLRTTGEISKAGPGREMQFGLKFIF